MYGAYHRCVPKKECFVGQKLKRTQGCAQIGYREDVVRKLKRVDEIKENISKNDMLYLQGLIFRCFPFAWLQENLVGMKMRAQ